MRNNPIYLGIAILSLFLFVSQVSAQYEKETNLNHGFRDSLAPGADIEDFRREMDKLLTDMQHILQLYMEMPGFRQAMDKAGHDPLESLKESARIINESSAKDLELFRDYAAWVPNIGEIPIVLESAIDEDLRSRLEARLELRKLGSTPVDSVIPDLRCGTFPVPSYFDLRALKVAGAIADGASAVIPEPFNTPFEIIATAAEIAWVIAEDLINIDTACTLEETLSRVKVIEGNSTGGAKEETVLTRSTQTSVNAVQSSVDIVQNKVDAANVKLVQLQESLTAFQDQNLRLHIEANLARDHDDDDDGSGPIAKFLLPTAQNGFLDEVREIVVDTFAKLQAAGLDIGNAQTFLIRGDAHKAAGRYKRAYAEYRKAYRKATKCRDNNDDLSSLDSGCGSDDLKARDLK